MTVVKDGQKTDLLVIVEEGHNDEELTFQDTFLPDLLEKNVSSLTSVEGIYFSLPESYKGILSGRKNSITRSGEENTAYWKDVLATTGSDHLVRVFGDTPFLDITVINDMVELHLKYLAEFTYSDNLPEGFSCEIIAGALINNIPEMEEETLALTKVIRSNINQFDVELYYLGPDIRDKRLSFRSSSPRDRRIMENITRIHGSVPPYEELKELIEKNPEILYVGPSYLEIEVTGRCDLDCIFCYRKSMSEEHGDMDPELFEKIVREMEEFDLPYTVCFGGSGEPLMHREFFRFAEIAAGSPLIERVILETAGLYITDELIQFLRKEENKKFNIIVNCNGFDSPTWKELHGADKYTRISETIDSLLELNAGEARIHLQVMKINETEPWLDRYYDYWEERKAPLILQKQNTCINRIEDRRYSDLSPLERTPCWHLQRDLLVLSDGRVSYCKQDIDGSQSRGSLKDSTIVELFDAGKENFLRDYRKDYAAQPDCRNCDEWYTFNF